MSLIGPQVVAVEPVVFLRMENEQFANSHLKNGKCLSGVDVLNHGTFAGSPDNQLLSSQICS